MEVTSKGASIGLCQRPARCSSSRSVVLILVRVAGGREGGKGEGVQTRSRNRVRIPPPCAKQIKPHKVASAIAAEIARAMGQPDNHDHYRSSLSSGMIVALNGGADLGLARCWTPERPRPRNPRTIDASPRAHTWALAAHLAITISVGAWPCVSPR